MLLVRDSGSKFIREFLKTDIAQPYPFIPSFLERFFSPEHTTILVAYRLLL